MSQVGFVEYLRNKHAFRKKVKHLNRKAEETLISRFYKSYALKIKDHRWVLESLEQKVPLYSLYTSKEAKTFSEPNYFLLEHDGVFFIFVGFKSITSTKSYKNGDFTRHDDTVIKRFQELFQTYGKQELFQTYGKQELSKSCDSPTWEQSININPQRLKSLFLLATFDCANLSDILLVNKRVDIENIKSKIKKAKFKTQCKLGNSYE